MKGTVRTPLPEPGTPLTEPSVDDDVAPEVAAPVPQRGRPSAALAVHGLTLAAAFSVWLYLDRKLWFFGDEWDFLTRRGLHGATFSIWAPHNEHWSVLPILLWRAIFSIAHLSAYWPYLVPLLLVHVAVVHLVWRRCLIEGVNIWVANAVALLLALFGTGAEDLAWAFQIGFLGSTALGLLALEVADARPGLAIGEAPGPTRLIVRRAVFDRPLLRDGLVSLLAVAALMCSDIGLAVCAALGLVLVARSGWARAARALAVPVGAYAIWFALAGHSGLASTGDTLGLSVFLKIPTFVATNLEMDLGHGVGWPAARYFLFAVVIAWLVLNARNLVRRHPAALAGAIAAVTFYALAAVGRDRISATMSPSRYAYVGIAFLLPSVALMLSSLPPALQGLRSRSWSRLRASHRRRTVLLATQAVVLIGLLAATVANVVSGAQFTQSRTVFVRGLRDQIVTTSFLLQDKGQLARAINGYPVWASGFAAGYLTPRELSALYREGFLGRPAPSLMTLSQVREDESWLDLSARSQPIWRSRFSLAGLEYHASPGAASGRHPSHGALASTTLGTSGLVERGAQQRPVEPAPGVGRRLAGWPTGPGGCIFSSKFWPQSGAKGAVPAATLEFAAARSARAAAVWISLGPRGGRVHFYLRRAWGFQGPKGTGNVAGETLSVPAGGYLWLNDSVAGTGLGLDLPAGQGAEICGLIGGRGGTAATAAR